jgi:hypothetical protein
VPAHSTDPSLPHHRVTWINAYRQWVLRSSYALISSLEASCSTRVHNRRYCIKQHCSNCKNPLLYASFYACTLVAHRSSKIRKAQNVTISTIHLPRPACSSSTSSYDAQWRSARTLIRQLPICILENAPQIFSTVAFLPSDTRVVRGSVTISAGAYALYIDTMLRSYYNQNVSFSKG